MGQFFDQYPKLKYDFLDNGLYQEIPDMFRQVRENRLKINQAIAYRWIDAAEMRPDQLSTHLYGSPQYHWTFFILNDHLYKGDNDWPLTWGPLEEYIERKYYYNTIRLYRETTDDIDYNRLDDRFPIGARMFGLWSGAQATVIGRDIEMNTIHFTYINDKVFEENQYQNYWEPIWVVEESDLYVESLDDIYYNYWYTMDPALVDIIIDKYDVREGPNSLHHWKDDQRGYWYHNYENLDFVLNPDANISFMINREYEQELNEERARIRYVRPELIEQFAADYKRLINA